MIKNPPHRFRPAVAALVLAGVTTAALADPASVQRRLSALGYVRGQPVAILPQDMIERWDYLDDSAVIVHTGAGGHYLVSLATECPALQSASMIAFNVAISGGLVESGALVVGSSASAPECAIGQILRLEQKPVG